MSRLRQLLGKHAIARAVLWLVLVVCCYGVVFVWAVLVSQGALANSLTRFGAPSLALYSAAVVGVVGLVAAVVMAVEAESMFLAASDCAAGCVSYSLACGQLEFDTLPTIAHFGLLAIFAILIGIYWTAGPGELWNRIGRGLLGYIAIAMAVLGSLVVQELGRERGFRPLLISVAMIAIGNCLTASIAAGFALIPAACLGWRIGTHAPRHGKPFQFDIRAMLAITTAVAIYFGFMHVVANTIGSNARIDRGNHVGVSYQVIVFMVVTSSFSGLAALLLAWLGFGPWTEGRIILVATLFCGPLILLLAFAAPHVQSRIVVEIFLQLVPLIAGTIFPIALARRHGYHWVQMATAPLQSPVVEDRR